MLFVKVGSVQQQHVEGKPRYLVKNGRLAFTGQNYVPLNDAVDEKKLASWYPIVPEFTAEAGAPLLHAAGENCGGANCIGVRCWRWCDSR